MWDRNPQKDFAQGNVSDCCIGLGRTNGRVIADYLLNLSLNMIEIFDNIENKTIGNALCFFAKDENDELIFIIDNIEIHPKYKPSEKVSKNLKSAIKEYAQNYLRETTGRDDISIYLGANNNDVVKADTFISKNIKFLGELNCNDIYLDVYNGWIKTKNLSKEVNLEKLD